MSFATTADLQNGYWGYTKLDKDGNSKFIPLGNEVIVENITTDIETQEVSMLLSCEYLGEKKWAEVSRDKLTEYSLLQELARIGADVTRKHFDLFVDSLRLQEHSMCYNGVGTEKVYSNVGWKSITFKDKYTGLDCTELCFRADSIVGNYSARYIGDLKISAMGRFDIWRKMVLKCVLGHTALEVVLLAGLSAVINGLIAVETTGENPIVHICGISGSGKSTGAILAASTAGEPYDGSRTITDKSGKITMQNSVYGSWSSTVNAVLNTCSGNRGYPIILNELGKILTKNMTSLIYNMSEGTDKKRLNQQMQAYQLEGFSTTIISVGEHSILSRCQSKADGLNIRVLEIDQPLTSSANQSDLIKAVCRKHNGHAVPMMAKHIIKNGGKNMVLDLYQQNRETLLENWPDTPSAERFVSKFPALFLTTADIAEKALNIKFSREAIINYFLDHEKVNGQNRNSAADSYNIIMEECRINVANFYRDDSKTAILKAWGRIVKVNKCTSSGKKIIEEYLIRPSIVKDILKRHDFENIKTCEAEWTAAEVLHREDTQHSTRARKIEPGSAKSERVYVFRVFADTEPVEEDEPQPAPTVKRTVTRKLVNLLADRDDEQEADTDEPA